MASILGNLLKRCWNFQNNNFSEDLATTASVDDASDHIRSSRPDVSCNKNVLKASKRRRLRHVSFRVNFGKFLAACEKCPNTEFFMVCYHPNTGKYWQEKTSCLGNFYTVKSPPFMIVLTWSLSCCFFLICLFLFSYFH